MSNDEISTLEGLLDRLAEVGDGRSSTGGTDTDPGEKAADDKPAGKADDKSGDVKSGGKEDDNSGGKEGDDDLVTLGEMLDAVGRRSFGPLLLLAGLVIVAPVVGDIPTVPTLMALVIFLVAVQLLARRKEFWLPGWVTRRSVKRKRIRKAVEGLRRPTRWVDRLLRRRLTTLTGTTGSMVIAGTCALLALAIPPMELVPFTATFAGIAVAGFGLALIAEDGLVALLAFTVTAGALAWALSAVL